MPWRVSRALVLCLFGGAALALATDQGGDGRSALAQFLNSLGSLSSPWVIIPFLVSAALATRSRTAAVLGLVSTTAALAGWYLCATLVEDLGGHGFLGDLRLEFRANTIYFEAGLVTGPLFGLLGRWWRRRRDLPATFVVGALMAGEPVVLFVLTALRGAGVLAPSATLPTVVRMVTNVALPDTTRVLAWLLELVVGVGVAALTMQRHRRRDHRRTGTQVAA